jgi:hypothetical protein
MTSSNPNDESQRYCGNCHRFEDDEVRETLSDDAWERQLNEQLARMNDRIARSQTICLWCGGVGRSGRFVCEVCQPDALVPMVFVPANETDEEW